MYGKVFESIYDGTLAEDWRALITFQQMIVLCDPDGTLDMTPASLSRRTGIPVEHIKAGIEILENPDPYSRTPNNEGRRIIRIDDHRPWGWVIVNHNKYKNLRTANDRREYMRNYMRNKRNSKVNDSLQEFTEVNSKQSLAQLANTDEDADTDTVKDIVISPPSPKSDPIPYQKIIDLYHDKLKDLPQVAKLTEKRKTQIRKLFKEDLKTLEEWGYFFDYVSKSDFLMGRKEPQPGRPLFRADIEWLTNQSNFTKIAEDKYHV